MYSHLLLSPSNVSRRYYTVLHSSPLIGLYCIVPRSERDENPFPMLLAYGSPPCRVRLAREPAPSVVSFVVPGSGMEYPHYYCVADLFTPLRSQLHGMLGCKRPYMTILSCTAQINRRPKTLQHLIPPWIRRQFGSVRGRNANRPATPF